MLRRILLVISLLGLALSACSVFGTIQEKDATAETTETQGVDVQGTPNLRVEHFLGNIVVRPGEDGHITAKVIKKSRLDDPARAEAQLEEIVMSFTQQGTDVTLTIDGPSGAGLPENAPSADLQLLVPQGTTLDLNLGGGNIVLEQPPGDVTVQNGVGDITAVMPGDASFRLTINGGRVDVTSEFDGVPAGGLATDIDVTIGDSPAQTLSFDLGSGKVMVQRAR